MLLPYERAINRFLMKKIILPCYGKVPPRWLWYHVLLRLPTVMGGIFGFIRFVVGFTLLTPFLLWPPAWPMLAAAWERARREAERRRRWH